MAGAGLTLCRPQDSIGQHTVRHRARERQQAQPQEPFASRMPVRVSSQAVTSTRMSITLRGCLRSKPVAMLMMLSLYHMGTQE